MNAEDKLLESYIWGETPKVTDDVVEYYRKHPQELNLIIDKGRFHSRFLMYFFVLGLVITIGVRLLRYFFEGSWGEFIDRVILDVISEIGIAIFGGAVTVYFLEHLKKKQYQESIRLRNEIRKRIQDLEKSRER